MWMGHTDRGLYTNKDSHKKFAYSYVSPISVCSSWRLIIRLATLSSHRMPSCSLLHLSELDRGIEGVINSELLDCQPLICGILLSRLLLPGPQDTNMAAHSFQFKLRAHCIRWKGFSSLLPGYAAYWTWAEACTQANLQYDITLKYVKESLSLCLVLSFLFSIISVSPYLHLKVCLYLKYHSYPQTLCSYS